MDTNDFQSQKHSTYTLKTREIQKELPSFCASFFRSIESTTSVLTRYAYAVDLRGFFQYAVREPELFPGREVPSLTLDDLNKIKAVHLEMYLEKMSLYYKADREVVNKDRAKARKLSTLRSFFKYYFRQELISTNVAALLDTPKIRDKAIIRLEPNEVADLLDMAENGEGLTDRQRQYHRNTRTRDVAILTLFLGTGIRISELVGIDIDDIDFANNEFVITRKGGAEDILAFGDEVAGALFAYLDERKAVTAIAGHENALFLSSQRKRITARAVEYLVKKYAAVATPLKKITPHKLRSTYGTMLYHETKDIYLVADVLGHKDVNTTKKHYAAQSQDNRRIAAKSIKLREE